jgi:hypothetical protein
MADFKQSREANQTNFVCRRGGTQLYRVLERKPDGVIVQDENGKPRFLNEGSFYNVYFDEPKPIGDLTVKLDVDASDAIRALKALQREARKATQALRELESEASRLEAEVAKAKMTNITVNIPNITVKDEADVEKIAKELAEKLQKYDRSDNNDV